MIQSVSLWHITPTDLGVEFFDPSTSVLTADQELYRLVNNSLVPLNKTRFSSNDYNAILKMRKFLTNVRNRLEAPAAVREFPGITGCIASYTVTENLSCYIMDSGIAVFFEKGDPIPIADMDYFSLPTFHERQIYEDDYCVNHKVSERKKALYDFLHLLWDCVDSKDFHYSASTEFGNQGIPYTLCITMIDDPDLISHNISQQMKRNIHALIDTSAFNNILQESQWDLIKKHIDSDDISQLKLMELSETLVFTDNWSGVLLAGDLSHNKTCIDWLLEFEVLLQSQWLLFYAYCENVSRQNMSAMDLQKILNSVEFAKINLDNDISSNMEQCRHDMRNSLIRSSDINTIYFRMHGMVTNKLKMKLMEDDRKKARFSLFSDLSLLSIALLELYGVMDQLLSRKEFTITNLISALLMALISGVCFWFMIKGRN